MSSIRFPKKFILGAATAAYQIEGGRYEGGKSESIWDKFCEIPGKIDRGETGEVACDHFHKFREDVALMKRMHLEAYRFSVSWPRVIKDGDGEVNREGIAFYASLIDELLAAGIEPVLTLYHWDLPHALQLKGGWQNPESAKWYLRYAEVLFDAFRGKVKRWITFNEPFVFTDFGYVTGSFPPGIKGDYLGKHIAAHNVLKAHGMAVRLFREKKMEGEIGITLDYAYNCPIDDSPENVQAAALANEFWAGWFYEPIVFGHYPERALKWFQTHGVAPVIREGDMQLIAEPIDFLGINHYFCNYVEADKSNTREGTRLVYPPRNQNDMGWAITEDGFEAFLGYLKKTLKVPLYITENGISLNDIVNLHGEVLDFDRIDYLERYLSVLSKAIEDGLDCRGYFYWSLMDNMEWAAGYKPRFGLIYVDYPTQTRLIKRSGEWYKSLIDAKNGNSIQR